MNHLSTELLERAVKDSPSLPVPFIRELLIAMNEADDTQTVFTPLGVRGHVDMERKL
jgi:hypothetical protein